MSKCRVSFDLDFSTLLPDADLKAVKAFIVRDLVGAAREHHRERLNVTRANAKLPRETKERNQRENLRSIQLSLLVDANISIQPLPPHAPVRSLAR